jgi:hypothetical protein
MEALNRVNREYDAPLNGSVLKSPSPGGPAKTPPAHLGRFVRMVVGTVLVIALFGFGSPLPWNGPAAWAEEDGEANIGFRWAFTAMVGEGSEVRVEPIRTGMELKTGDQFKMLVELQKKCFVYVVYHNAQDEVSLLFPYSLQQFNADYDLSKKYYIPKGEGWFELDSHAGRETFYLLASTERLSELEHLFNWYVSAEEVKKPDITRQILAEIRNIKTDHRDLASAAERPVPIGGVVRGIERAQGANRANIETVSEEISATDFYAKTFTIEHR